MNCNEGNKCGAKKALDILIRAIKKFLYANGGGVSVSRCSERASRVRGREARGARRRPSLPTKLIIDYYYYEYWSRIKSGLHCNDSDRIESYCRTVICLNNLNNVYQMIINHGGRD